MKDSEGPERSPGYRDHRNAVYARVDALERELERTQREATEEKRRLKKKLRKLKEEKRRDPDRQIVLSKSSRTSAKFFRIFLPLGILISLLLSSLVVYWSTRGDESAPPATVYRMGRVSQVSGKTSAKLGARCEIWIVSEVGKRYNCHVMVSCNGTSIYDGATNCVYASPKKDVSKRPIRARDPYMSPDWNPKAKDADKDPALDMDLARGNIHIEDRSPRFSVVIKLDTERDDKSSSPTPSKL